MFKKITTTSTAGTTKENPLIISNLSQIPQNFIGYAFDKVSKVEYSFLYGQYHSFGDDEPAVVYDCGFKHWYKRGIRHRDNDKPAIESDFYLKKEWWVNGQRHRVNGPAILEENGDEHWFFEGKLHRENGPAVDCADGSKEWFLNGKEYSEEDWKKLVKSRHQNPNDILLESIKFSI